MNSESHHERLLRGIERIAHPHREWVPPREAGDPHQLLIVGGGQAALALMMALRLENIQDVICLEQKEEGEAGIWTDSARMKELRTPKIACGMELGIPELSSETWYRENYGDDAWEKLDRIPRLHWAQYLEWYRRTLKIPVQFSCRVVELEPIEGGLFQVYYEEHHVPKQLVVRRVVLANGIAGSGEWAVPRSIETRLPATLFRHTNQSIDFESFAGKPLAVLGAAASAFDNAICALEAGAEKVDLFCRSPELGSVNAQEWAAFTGFLRHHSQLSDKERWRFFTRIFEVGQLPSAESYRLAVSFLNFFIHTDQDALEIKDDGGEVFIRGKFGEGRYCQLIVGTGFRTDLRLRPELKHFVDDIKIWQDTGLVDDTNTRHCEMGQYPYLKGNFSFVSRSGAQKDWLDRLFCFNYGALISNGLSAASITGLKYSIPKIVQGIGEQIYKENLDYYFHTLENYPKDEFRT